MSNKENFLKTCMIIDTETTGLDTSTAEIVEFGFVLREDNDWVMFNELHKPYTPLTPECSAINLISNRMLADKKHFDDKEVLADLKEIFDILKPDGNIVCHNAIYDKAIITRYEGLVDESLNWICTYRLAKRLYNSDTSVTKHTVPYLRFRFDLDVPEDVMSHRAASDAFVTAKLLEHLVTEMEERGIIDVSMPYGEQIKKYLVAPIIYDTMPFGKYKGVDMNDIPLDYFSWMIENIDTLDENSPNYNSDLFESIALAVEKKLSEDK